MKILKKKTLINKIKRKARINNLKHKNSLRKLIPNKKKSLNFQLINPRIIEIMT